MNDDNQRPVVAPPSSSSKPGEGGSKSNRKLIVIVSVVAGLLLVVASVIIVALLLRSSGDENKKVAEAMVGAPVVATESSAYIANGYSEGARPLIINGSDVLALGLYDDGKKLAVLKSESIGSSELAIYDTTSLKNVAEVKVDDCVAWAEEDSVVCSTDARHGGPGRLMAYSAKDATPVSEGALYEHHPFATERANLSSIDELNYVGKSGDDFIFSLAVSNSFLSQGDMTEEERAIATQGIGMAYVKKHLVVALDGSGGEKWSYEVSSDDVCGLIGEGKSVLCLDTSSLAIGPESSVTPLTLIDATDGKLVVERDVQGRVGVASDGWLEYDDSMPEDIDVESLLSTAMQGQSVKVFDLSGKMTAEKNMTPGSQPGMGFIPESEWNSIGRAAYSLNQLLGAKPGGQVIAADGRLVGTTEVSQTGESLISLPGTGKTVKLGQISHVSADGRTVLAIDNDNSQPPADDWSDGGWSAYIVDVETGKKLAVLDKGSAMLMKSQNGIIVSTIMADFSSESLESSTVVYVPGK